MSDALASLLELNFAAAVAIAVVLALRLPVRRLFGPQVAYGLWALVPLAAAAMLAPARVIKVREAAPALETLHLTAAAPSAPASSGLDLTALLVVVWLLGLAVSVALLMRRQAQFACAERAGRAGPAAVGVLRPRVVTPADFEARYSAREQQVILAHERTHIRRQDPRTNALVAAVRCAAWFNPLVHLMGHLLRIDQELACDAEVVAAHPAARRSYAEAMLKTQLAARPLPLGCYWPAEGVHPLAARIGLLGRAQPDAATRIAGAAAVSALALGVAVGVWQTRAPRVVVEPPRPVAALPPMPKAPAPTPAAAAQPAVAAPQPAAAAVVPAPETQIADAWPEPEEPAVTPATFEPISDAKVHGVAERSRVEPGSAVRVIAQMTDPRGNRLVTDLTAYGSQQAYRTGSITREASRYALFTSVVQRGDHFDVTASLSRAFRGRETGTTTLASGETGTILLPNGLPVTVTPILRAETPEEMEEGRRIANGFTRVRQFAEASMDRRMFDCGQRGAIC